MTTRDRGAAKAKVKVPWNRRPWIKRLVRAAQDIADTVYSGKKV